MKKENLLAQSGVSEIQLTYISKTKPSERPVIKTAYDAYKVFLQSWDRGKISFVEQFKVMLLTRANSVIGIIEVSSGGVTGTVADPKIIIASAIKSNSVGLMLAHNHPSGSLKPSKADEDLTRKIREAAKFFDLKLLDHLIVTEETYFSMAEEGLV